MAQIDPINSIALSPVVLRASTTLPAAGAYDSTPTAVFVSGFQWLTLFFRYTRGAAGGAFAFKIEGQRAGDTTNWYHTTRYAGGAVTTGADVSSDVQREEVEYGSQAAAAELFVFGPIRVERGVDKLRVAAKETGVVGTPGTLVIEAVLS